MTALLVIYGKGMIQSDPFQDDDAKASSENRPNQSLIRAQWTPHGESHPAGQSTQNLTEVQVPAAQSIVPEIEPPLVHNPPAAIASGASDVPGRLSPDNAGYDLTAIVLMPPDELQQLAHQPSPVPAGLVQALLFLGQVKTEGTSDELRASIEKAHDALNDYERALRNVESTARQAHLSTNLSFALGALSSALQSEKAVRAYGNLLKGARKPRALSAPWQAVNDDFRERGGRQTQSQAYTAYKSAGGTSDQESFRTSFYKKRKERDLKV